MKDCLLSAPDYLSQAECDVPVLFTRTCACITLRDERDLADVIKSKHREMGEIIPDYAGRPHLITWLVKSRTLVLAAENQRDGLMKRTGCVPLAFMMEEEGPEPRHVVASQSWRRQGNRLSRRAASKERSLVLAHWDSCRTSDLQNWKIINVCFKPLNLW